MRSSIIIITALLVLAVAAQDTCSQYGSCVTCTATYPCGWCTATGTCQTGNATGSPTCQAPYWDWLQGQCNAVPTPAPLPPSPTYACPMYDTCAQCTVLPGCGFCSLSNTCVPGSQTQSYWGNCSGTNWAWVTNQCSIVPTPAPAPPTPTYACPLTDNCAQCTVLPGCGFCALSNTCVPGTQTQSYWGNCSGTNWAWVNTQCNTIPTPAPAAPTPGNVCPSTFSCHKCTLLEGCDYCTTTGCQSANATCSGTVYYNLSQCGATPTAAPPTAPPAPTAACDSNLKCAQCTALAGCGFCSYSGCQAGNSTGGFNGCTGSYWSWLNTQCPTAAPSSTCSPLTTCNGCTATVGCGWCGSTSTCQTGNVTGPAWGTCANWDFLSEQC